MKKRKGKPDEPAGRPADQQTGSPAPVNMEFTDFLKRHPGHNVGAITDRVIVQCFDCKESFFMTHEQWAKIEPLLPKPATPAKEMTEPQMNTDKHG